ncbi:uncharacterized protein LOC127082247 [Lathyrus oleraceus]|uniref:uncharacterized protein LOC127082247 n=1 Tax=Pisum sativum TaxID=3888 RepID=UPI0021D12EF7|nr:uncharacterized protein LOC127082247 [Pisum sativum]
MKRETQEFIRQCVVCQQTKYSTQKPGGLLQPLPLPQHIWEDISMDFITGLPPSKGFTVIMVVVDRFSKAIHLGALATGFTAYKVAELFVSIVCKHHGLPKSIISDRDSIFISRFWKDLFTFSGTLLRMSSAYHPQTDGQAKWVALLPWAEYHYNTSVHTASGLSPFQVMFGKLPPSISPYIAGSSSIDACDSVLQSRDEILHLLPKVGHVAYKLELPSHSRIHNVFHSSLLKLHEGVPPTVIDQIPHDSINNHPVVTPLAVLEFQTRLIEGIPTRFALVQWQRLSPDDTSWENWEELRRDYNLEDKVDFVGGSIDTGKPIRDDIGPIREVENNQEQGPRTKRIIKIPKRLEDYVTILTASEEKI